MGNYQEPTKTDQYECPDCGAFAHTPVYSMCDECVMKFYFDNPNSTPLPNLELDAMEVISKTPLPNHLEPLTSDYEPDENEYDIDTINLLGRIEMFFRSAGTDGGNKYAELINNAIVMIRTHAVEPENPYAIN